MRNTEYDVEGRQARLQVVSFEHPERKNLAGHVGNQGRRHQGGTMKNSSYELVSP